MRYNINSGWGQVVGQLPFLGSGKVFIVGKAALANRSMVEELFKVDPDGKVRGVFTTLDAAVGECTHDQNDVIYVLPGHTENLSSASALTLDVRGITIIGLGHGKMRPVITLDTAATADIGVGADDVTIKNIIFSANYADIACLFEIGAAKQFCVEDCEFLATATNMNFLIIFRTNTTANAADGLTIKNCVSIQPDTANTYFAHLQEDIDRFTMEDCYINMGVNTSDLPIVMVATGKDITNAKILRNHASRLNDANDLFINSDTAANSGVVAHNTMLHADTGTEVLIDLTGAGCFENYASAVVDKSGFLLPSADS